MSLDVFNALVRGYNDRLIDQQALAAQAGYWSSYYRSKHPKKISDLVSSIVESKFARPRGTVETSEEDVLLFEKRELYRMTTYNRWEKKNG